ncbi:MAG: hypothetical protein FJX45_13145 [Alphaproteobacteria bacterium]|nr:hypothetical protein [Alphaproteobacteria bacterium]
MGGQGASPQEQKTPQSPAFGLSKRPQPLHSRELGFSIEDIRALLALAEPPRASCAEVREIALLHLDKVRTKLADLARLECILAATLAQCWGDVAPSCPVLDMLDAGLKAPASFTHAARL